MKVKEPARKVEEVTRIVTVKVQPLTREGMKPYGDILDSDHPIFPQVDAGHGAITMEINTMDRNRCSTHRTR